MALRGKSGDGKTMLLAKLALHIEVLLPVFLHIDCKSHRSQEQMKDKYLFFYYFLDGAFHQNASQVMVTNLIQELHKYLSKCQRGSFTDDSISIRSRREQHRLAENRRATPDRR